MQEILQKHESENRKMAEQLVAFKQQLIESDNFTKSNLKFTGFRIGSFGAKTSAVLYFTEESEGQNDSEIQNYIIMQYGSGSAIKVDIGKLDEFYIIEGTKQI